MTWFLDSSTIIRYLVGTPEELASRARSLIDSDQPLLVSTAVIEESAHALRHHYHVPRPAVVEALAVLLGRANVTVNQADDDLVIEALLFCLPSGRVSIADALLWAEARSHTPAGVYSFDQRFPSEGIEVREP